MSPNAREAALSAAEVFCGSRTPEQPCDEVRVERSRRGKALTSPVTEVRGNAPFGALWETRIAVAGLGERR